jgi:hypothetical protein
VPRQCRPGASLDRPIRRGDLANCGEDRTQRRDERLHCRDDRFQQAHGSVRATKVTSPRADTIGSRVEATGSVANVTVRDTQSIAPIADVSRAGVEAIGRSCAHDPAPLQS